MNHDPKRPFDPVGQARTLASLQEIIDFLEALRARMLECPDHHTHPAPLDEDTLQDAIFNARTLHAFLQDAIARKEDPPLPEHLSAVDRNLWEQLANVGKALDAR